jgi:hypothetical protein
MYRDRDRDGQSDFYRDHAAPERNRDMGKAGVPMCAPRIVHTETARECVKPYGAWQCHGVGVAYSRCGRHVFAAILVSPPSCTGVLWCTSCDMPATSDADSCECDATPRHWRLRIGVIGATASECRVDHVMPDSIFQCHVYHVAWLREDERPPTNQCAKCAARSPRSHRHTARQRHHTVTSRSRPTSHIPRVAVGPLSRP